MSILNPKSLKQAENTELRYHQRRLDILFRKKLREGWGNCSPTGNGDNSGNSGNSGNKTGMGEKKEESFKIVMTKVEEERTSPKKCSVSRSQTVDEVLEWCTPRVSLPRSPQPETPHSIHSTLLPNHISQINTTNINTNYNTQNTQDTPNWGPSPPTLAFSCLDTDMELDQVYERQFLSSAKKKVRPKLQLSDLPPWRIRAAHIDKIRGGDRSSMDNMLKLVKDQRLSERFLWE